MTMSGFLPKATLAVAVALLLATTAAALPAFTTTPKTASPRGDAAELYGASAGCHATFDRFVIRARFATPGYDARYVRRIVADPSGRPISLLGAKRIRIALNLAAGHDNRGRNLLAATLTPRCATSNRSRRPATSRARSRSASASAEPPASACSG